VDFVLEREGVSNPVDLALIGDEDRHCTWRLLDELNRSQEYFS
jgi:hypothetical protein